MNIIERDIETLIPYANNPRNNDSAVDAVAASIKEFGFKVPIIIDKEGVIVAGHTRLKAAKKLGLETVPVIEATDLTDAQVKAFRLADNKVGELAAWDFEKLDLEMQDITLEMIDFGFSNDADWFSQRERNDTARQEGNDEYNAFLDKFEEKKTTDDCYTPDTVYDAIATWVENEYKLDRKNFVRPFYPGGDYQGQTYKKDDIVVDNPPFSILSEIIKYYDEHGVKFFLFAPSLTIFSTQAAASATALCIGVSILYKNNAEVSTSFLTNLEGEGVRFRSAPSLYKIVDEAVIELRKEQKQAMPKYEYPNEVITSAKIAYLSKYGIDFRATKDESCHIRGLDSQRDADKAIFGSGFLLSERKAAEKAEAERIATEKAEAEKAAAEVWTLSDREREIIKSLV